MDDALATALNWGSDKGPPAVPSDNSEVLVVSDSLDTPGGFVLLSLLARYLGSCTGGEGTAVILSFDEDAAHYSATLRKMGVNLPELLTSGRAVFIDAATDPHNWIIDGLESRRQTSADDTFTASPAVPSTVTTTSTASTSTPSTPAVVPTATPGSPPLARTARPVSPGMGVPSGGPGAGAIDEAMPPRRRPAAAAAAVPVPQPQPQNKKPPLDPATYTPGVLMYSDAANAGSGLSFADGLAAAVEAVVAELTKAGAPVLLVVDSVGELRSGSIGCLSTSETVDFVRRLAGTVRDCPAENSCSVFRIHGDVDEDTAAVAALQHTASATLEVSPLDTGYSKDVDGQIVVTRLPALFVTAPLPSPTVLHYKLMDSLIRYVVKGEVASSALAL